MSKFRDSPEVNAGSMADIAFLLLIFFLVTATLETDAGINRKLPPNELSPPVEINERNILRIHLNKNNEIMVEDRVIDVVELKALTIAFLDNGGAPKGNDDHCDYCRGERSNASSDSPADAVISFKSDRQARYAMYVTIHDQLEAAFNELRNREARRLFETNYTEMKATYFNPETSLELKKELRVKINMIKAMFPQKIAEIETVLK